ncbi:caprin-1 isoform X2 [Parasteatoda tepidariorum]|uniref:caprin-1 isoform X2 n=1 Tax=Parasteatoda tepidariorum TaxID=114398 RepID=UPI000A2C0112|nr:caprin-1 isoform X2 [Parasteatoda tepidariorum]
MPSASAKLEKQTSLDTNDPVKQVITVVEKKVRNLEKRKGKLDSYKSDSQKGKELNEDQKKAVEKYDQVVELLEFAKDLQKQFQTVIQDCTKAQKRAAKLELLERQQLERQRIKEFLMYQDLLSSMGGEDVRQDFLEGNKGAVKLSEEELNSIDELYKIICPERDPEVENAEFDTFLNTSAEHIQSLLDAKNKEAFGTTYKSLREMLQKIHNCSYFNKSEVEPLNEEAENSNDSEEKEDDKNLTEEYVHPAETYPSAQVEDFPEKSESQVEPPPYYQIENQPIYSAEQPHPIQEVLSVQGNLNFLQESQIEVESSLVKSQIPPSLSYTEYSAPPQPMPPNLVQQQRTRRTSEETSHPVTANIALATVPSPQSSIPPVLQPTTQPIDFDPARPIPTQTYTNQSFTSAIHPMIAVPPSYVPVTHSISPAHVLPANMVLPQRSSVVVTNSLPSSQLGTESPQSAPSTQFDCNEIPESNITKQQSFGNGGEALGESRSRAGSNPYARGSSQMEYRNDRAYQSTNNSQAYMNRESFADNSSYSSNLKRGLSSQRGSRSTGNAPRAAANNLRGGRVGYRN